MQHLGPVGVFYMGLMDIFLAILCWAFYQTFHKNLRVHLESPSETHLHIQANLPSLMDQNPSNYYKTSNSILTRVHLSFY